VVAPHERAFGRGYFVLEDARREPAEETLTQVRFMLVAAPVGSLMRWPGGWFALSEPVAPNHAVWFAWRLLSANNRELGRSYSTFPDTSACAQAVAVLRTRMGDAEPAIVAGLRTGWWHWEVRVDGGPIAIAARSFTRQRECEHNLEQFMAGVNVVRADLAAVAEQVS